MADPTPTTTPVVAPAAPAAWVSTLKHLGLLAVLGAASVVIMPAFAAVSHLNVSAWPVALQSIYNLLIPILGQMVVTWQNQVNALLQAQENAKLMAKNMELQAKLLPASKPKALKAPKTNG